MTRTILLIALLSLPSASYGHSWYDFQCCNEQDCRQTTLGEVEHRPDGWYVVSTGDLIPYGDKRIKQSLDPLIHVCLKRRYSNDPRPLNPAAVNVQMTPRCLYVADPGI